MSPIIQLTTAFTLVAPLGNLQAHSPLETQFNQGWEEYLGDDTDLAVFPGILGAPILGQFDVARNNRTGAISFNRACGTSACRPCVRSWACPLPGPCEHAGHRAWRP